MDTTAFLNADVDKDNYIDEAPQGIIGVDSGMHVCKLMKAINY